jgi:hypothetical protein
MACTKKKWRAEINEPHSYICLKIHFAAPSPSILDIFFCSLCLIHHQAVTVPRSVFSSFSRSKFSGFLAKMAILFWSVQWFALERAEQGSCSLQRCFGAEVCAGPLLQILNVAEAHATTEMKRFGFGFE